MAKAKETVKKTFTTKDGKCKVLVIERTKDDSINRQFDANFSEEDGIEKGPYKTSFTLSNLIERLKDDGWINNEDGKAIKEWGESIGVS